MFKKNKIHTKKIKIILKKIIFLYNSRVVKLTPNIKCVGKVLISYNTTPFIQLERSDYGGHSQYWEIFDITNSFLERGYSVDVIDFDNKKFKPTKKYDVYLDIGSNLDRLLDLLNENCYKIFYATGSHWLFQNLSELHRIENLRLRRKIVLLPKRQIEPVIKFSKVDLITGLCGDFPSSTYNFLEKRKKMLPISTTHTFKSPEFKKYNEISKNYIWFGGTGAVHKGLDLVLESFKEMPDYKLFVLGKSVNEKGFSEEYKNELFNTKNIISIGHIDPSSEQFKKICSESLAIIYPSCSEGTSGSVILAMHAGLIPIVSRESGIKTEDFGILLETSDIKEISSVINKLSSEPTQILKDRSIKSWNYANRNHTREKFASEFRSLIDSCDLKHSKIL